MDYTLGLKDLASRYDGFLVDIWGVLHDGDQAFEGVKECFEALKVHHKQVILLSNSPRRRRILEENLTALGLPPSLYTLIHSSGEDAYEYLKDHRFDLGEFCYPLSSPSHRALFEDLDLPLTQDIHQADFILNTGPSFLILEEYDSLLKTARDRDLVMMCINPDISVLSQGKMVLCAGALAQRYEAFGGRVTYHGKPEMAIYENTLKKFRDLEKSQILAIGDSLKTDILGARNAGFDSALVMTGLTAQALNIEQGTFPNPHALKTFCAEKKIFPNYILQKFMWD